MLSPLPTLRHLGIQPYLQVFEAMQRFTSTRGPTTPDEIWLLEHEPVYTQGQAGKAEHVLHRNDIPIVQSDRGGQITYHAPGQLVIYVLIDLTRKSLGVRNLVSQLEKLVIDVLRTYGVDAEIHCGAPGVYVIDKKIASIGLRVKRGCTYHGIALNVDMDLTPFSDINPCGYAKLAMTQLSDFVPDIRMDEVRQRFVQHLFPEPRTCLL